MTSRYSPREWVELKPNPESQTGRWTSIVRLAASNGQTISLNDKEKLNHYGTQLIDSLLSGTVDPYRTANQLVRDMVSEKYSRLYIGNMANYAKLFFKINRVDIVDEEWSAKVAVPHRIREKDKGTLTLEGVRALVKSSDLEYQTLYELMAIGGGRVSETIRIRMKDIFYRPEIPDIPLVRLGRTKTGLSRDFPISQECLGLIQKFQPRKTGDYPLFPHLVTLQRGGKDAATSHCHIQLVNLGLTRKTEWLNGEGEAWTVNLHNFRQFAENNIVKHWGDFEAPDVAKWLVGRKSGLGSRSAYQTIEDIAPRWKEWIEPHTKFL